MAERTDSIQNKAVSRAVPEGTVPLIAIEGTAYECGRHYAEITMERYPGYRRYLDPAYEWKRDLLGGSVEARKLIEQRVPHIAEVYRGIVDVGGPPQQKPPGNTVSGCTSFGLSGKVTLDGHPISGGTRDVAYDKVQQHIVLRMRIKDAPAFMMHTYPGSIRGQDGFWSTGMSIFSNSLYSKAGANEGGMTSMQWTFLALAGSSVQEALELAEKFGIMEYEYGPESAGNMLISDPQGECASVEYNAGGVSVIPAREGIATHANHPEGERTAPFAGPQCFRQVIRSDSLYRMHGLWELFYAERTRLTAQKAMHLLADHTRYPQGVCSHVRSILDPESGQEICNPEYGTTAAIVAEPTLGKLHATRGNPCSNWPVTYSL